jgi:hypothetical protein
MLTRKLEGKEPLGKVGCRWDAYISTFVTTLGREDMGEVAGSCKHGNNPARYI